MFLVACQDSGAPEQHYQNLHNSCWWKELADTRHSAHGIIQRTASFSARRHSAHGVIQRTASFLANHARECLERNVVLGSQHTWVLPCLYKHACILSRAIEASCGQLKNEKEQLQMEVERLRDANANLASRLQVCACSRWWFIWFMQDYRHVVHICLSACTSVYMGMPANPTSLHARSFSNFITLPILTSLFIMCMYTCRSFKEGCKKHSAHLQCKARIVLQ